MTTDRRQIVGVPSEAAVTVWHPMEPMQDDASLVFRLAHGEGSALEPLMEVWGDHLVDTCFRALRDAVRALDLYAEVWATIYDRVRYGTQPLPQAFGPWQWRSSPISLTSPRARAGSRTGRGIG